MTEELFLVAVYEERLKYPPLISINVFFQAESKQLDLTMQEEQFYGPLGVPSTALEKEHFAKEQLDWLFVSAAGDEGEHALQLRRDQPALSSLKREARQAMQQRHKPLKKSASSPLKAQRDEEFKTELKQVAVPRNILEKCAKTTTFVLLQGRVFKVTAYFVGGIKKGEADSPIKGIKKLQPSAKQAWELLFVKAFSRTLNKSYTLGLSEGEAA